MVRKNQGTLLTLHSTTRKGNTPSRKFPEHFPSASNILTGMPPLALTDLLGAPVFDQNGAAAGKVREVAVVPQDNSSQILGLVVKTRGGDCLLVLNEVNSINGGVRASNSASDWIPYAGGEGMLLLARDLLDQQIIDVHGRKVVRVNDVDIHEEFGDDHVVLKVGAVDVGPRGAV